MAFVDWSEKYSVGVAQVDQQHKKLVALINQLHDAMSSGKGQAALTTVCSELVSYAKTHFAQEEQLLKLHRYPDLAAHQAVHAKLDGEVAELQRKVESKQAVLTMDVMAFLRTWLTDHIMQTDQKYAGHLKQAGVR
jgi:hemerythrin